MNRERGGTSTNWMRFGPLKLTSSQAGKISLLFQVPLLFSKNRLLVRSSLVTRSSALPEACQLRPDIALTEPEQLNKLIQLGRGSFAASV